MTVSRVLHRRWRVAGTWQLRRGMTERTPRLQHHQLKASEQLRSHSAMQHLATVDYGAETAPAIRMTEEQHPPSLCEREAVRPRLVRLSIESTAHQTGKLWNDSNGIEDFSSRVCLSQCKPHGTILINCGRQRVSFQPGGRLGWGLVWRSAVVFLTTCARK